MIHISKASQRPLDTSTLVYLKNYKTNFSAGYNEFVLEDLNDLPVGVLFFNLDTGKYLSKGKIVHK